jgi:hypothetical protein
MASVKRPSSSAEAARPYLEGVAKNLADRIWGPNGPAWGTSLTDLENLVVSLQQILSEKMLQLALQRQADDEAQRTAEFRQCPSCSGPTEPRDPEPRIVNTRAGEAQWQEPQAHCTRCRRAFFPSVQKPGD